MATAFVLLMNGRVDGRPLPEVGCHLPPGPSIWIKRQRDAFTTTTWAVHAGPFLDFTAFNNDELTGIFVLQLWERRPSGHLKVEPQPAQAPK